MSTSRLELYNIALQNIGQRTISTLSDNVEERYLIDNVWNADVVDHCLEEGQWYFAMRTVMVDYDATVTTPFGYPKAFSKPDDWILTSALCSDEFFKAPLLDYDDDANYWYANEEIIYVKYVSNDSNYGGDLSKWPRTFSEFVAAHISSKVALVISNAEKFKEILLLRKALLNDAKNKCAMVGPTKFFPEGSWTRSRTRGYGRGDRGNKSGDLY